MEYLRFSHFPWDKKGEKKQKMHVKAGPHAYKETQGRETFENSTKMTNVNGLWIS